MRLRRRRDSPSGRRHRNMNSAYRRKLQARLGGEQNWRCCYCGCVLELGTLTIEHVIPAAAGGTNEWTNLAAACGACNSEKGREYVADRK
jgi:uncharacterized protein (TIGR02646 family)